MSSELYESLTAFRNKKVVQFMQSPLVADADNPISKIIGILIENDAYEVFIRLTTNSIASVNVRDILSVRNIVSTKASSVARRIPSLSEQESNIGYAARIMSHYRLRALPIVQDNNKIIGQITAKELLKAIYSIGSGRSNAASTHTINASNIMTPGPIVIGTKDSVSTAKSIMMRRRIDHLPVIKEKNKNLVGMLTSTHIAKAMLPSEKIGRKSVGIDNKPIRLDLSVIGVADHDGGRITTSNIDDSLRSVTGLMVDMNSTYSVIIALDKVRGIITYRDIIALLGERVQEEDIPAFIIGLPDDPLDAELAKSKFTSMIRLLRKISPEIEEAICHIKIRNMEGERKRYEVDVNIIMPNRRHSYRNMGWDLTTIFHQMSDSMKKKLGHRPLGRQKESIRHLSDVTEGQPL
ncbi:MAG TPA: CBS domain-containing protein [Candidatus Bathyarchaeia archaeon]|nr:CBS domain-containing protein [Candidatus Bathyarchaeia archaeon]